MTRERIPDRGSTEADQIGIILGKKERRLREAWLNRVAEIIEEEGERLDFLADGLPILCGVARKFFDDVDERMAAVTRIVNLEERWLARGESGPPRGGFPKAA